MKLSNLELSPYAGQCNNNNVVVNEPIFKLITLILINHHIFLSITIGKNGCGPGICCIECIEANPPLLIPLSPTPPCGPPL